MSRKQSRGNPLLLVLLLLVIGAMAGVFVVYEIDNKKAAEQQQLYEQLLRLATVTDWPAAEPAGIDLSENPASGEGETQDSGVIHEPLMDFTCLWEQNQDIVAWLSVSDTAVDYPILQSQEKDYYLNHNLDGSKGRPGCIFIEGFNDKNFEDPMTIAYGHRMSNGTMFAPLLQYQDEGFLMENREVTVFLPDRNLHYEVIASSQYSDQHLMIDSLLPAGENDYQFTGMTGEEGLFFMYRLKGYGDKNAIFTPEAEITGEDKLLILSTCSKATNTKRFLVVCKRK